MALNQHKRAVGIFPSIEDATLGLTELQAAGFPMERVSVIARDADDEDEIAGARVRAGRGNQADEGAEAGAFAGGTLGTVAGLLVGLGLMSIPGIGPIVLGGAAATALATTLAGSAIGTAAGGLVGGLVGLGIPEDRARVYSEGVSRGEYVVMVEGAEEEINLANRILSERGIQEWGVFEGSRGEPATAATAGPVERRHP
ncbi:hypothetical protein [Kamptonema formosum]|uniref:hypothetical protein n=1 Tax=Kamptonema formosum TaxID=331992 RepID=UPI0003490CA5|nr:hypothetical protein [Oscillatoria sp. PCC 10802]